MKGKLIVIEGADGAGKATQAKLLVAALAEKGVAVESLDFPQYKTNHFGRLLRECLDGKRGDFLSVDAHVASVLYAADRFESAPKITGWLKEGKTVVLDRYVSSNMLHQGAKISDTTTRKEFLDWLYKTEHEVFGVPEPDCVIYLDVPNSTRQLLLFTDSSRASVDVAERSTEHQTAADQCATELIKQYGWKRIKCVKDGEIRSREEIHADVLAALGF